jgi:hypothetical protein
MLFLLFCVIFYENGFVIRVSIHGYIFQYLQYLEWHMTVGHLPVHDEQIALVGLRHPTMYGIANYTAWG